MARSNSDLMLGGAGPKRLTGTSAITPDSGNVFWAIDNTSDATLTIASLQINGAAASAWDNFPLASGKALYLDNITSITPASGQGVAYQR